MNMVIYDASKEKQLLSVGFVTDTGTETGVWVAGLMGNQKNLFNFSARGDAG